LDNSRQLPGVSFILPTLNIKALPAGYRVFNVALE